MESQSRGLLWVSGCPKTPSKRGRCSVAMCAIQVTVLRVFGVSKVMLGGVKTSQKGTSDLDTRRLRENVEVKDSYELRD